MNILITGGNTNNKGAYLMLLATKEQGSKYFPNAKFILPPTLSSKSKLKELGFSFLNYPLYHVGSGKVFRLGLKFPVITRILSLVLKRKKINGTVRIQDVDLVLDVSGYAFGDKFGMEPINNLNKLILFFKHRSVPFVMMPQALGPFSKEKKIVFSSVIENASFVFARDEMSFQNIFEISNSKLMAKQNDITLSLKSSYSLPKRLMNFDSYCCIVPNIRMLDKADETWKNNYLEFLSQSINIILEKSDFNILLLVHSSHSSGDGEITNKVYNSFKGNARIRIETDENPLILKTIIKNANFLIGSRFHAIVSGLSSDTPVIGTSWLHKYEMLFEEYGVPDYCFNKFSTDIFIKIEELLDKEKLNSYKAILSTKNEVFFKENEKMWRTILKSI